MKYFGLQASWARAEKSSIIRLVNGKLVVKSVFSSCDVLIVLGARA